MKIPDFSQAKVLVIGDLMLDRYWHGDTSRISPESPVPVVNVQSIENRAGGAANVALNLAELGVEVAVLGITGKDEESEILEAILEAKKIRTIFEKRPSQTTITKLRVISRNQQLIRLDFEKDFALDKPLDIELVKENINKYDLLVLSDYNKGTLKSVQQIIQLANGNNKKTVVDPKGNDFGKYKGATLITPNQSEFNAVAGETNEQNICSKGEALRNELKLGAVLITRSEKGMALIEKDQEPYLQPTQAREISDVTGAGDTVVATLAATLASGENLITASRLANVAAGVVISKLGTATTSVSELEAAIAHKDGEVGGVVSESKLLALITNAKVKRETVVMTNGCFDILHPGHVAYLKQAAELGDKLIVAVNDDASVKRLKGEERPINPLEHRMEMLAALDSVDWVVSFSEDTPQRIIANCLPTTLVKGGDYKAEEIVGYKEVIDNGGQVKILQFKEGYSTTKIIKTIKEHNI